MKLVTFLSLMVVLLLPICGFTQENCASIENSVARLQCYDSGQGPISSRHPDEIAHELQAAVNYEGEMPGKNGNILVFQVANLQRCVLSFDLMTLGGYNPYSKSYDLHILSAIVDFAKVERLSQTRISNYLKGTMKPGSELTVLELRGRYVTGGVMPVEVPPGYYLTMMFDVSYAAHQGSVNTFISGGSPSITSGNWNNFPYISYQYRQNAEHAQLLLQEYLSVCRQ